MKRLLSAPLQLVIAAAALTTHTTSHAGASGTVGFVSEYYYRGANLGDAAAYVGADYEKGGFYLGTWWIDDGAVGAEDGFETDFYAGYGIELGTVSLGIGYNRYEYTYSSDYEHEAIFSVELGRIAVEYAVGQDEDEGAEGTDFNYAAVSWGGETFGINIGNFENTDSEDSYIHVELSASGEISGLSASVTVGNTTNQKSGGVKVESGDGYIFLDISKTIDF